jgi:hypothetical protein
MIFRIEIWSINRLKQRYDEGKLNLNPPYQRKFIWSLSDQQTLIQSIIKGYAIPNIFLHEINKDLYEMVDGQQRTRTILGFIDNQFTTFDGISYDNLINQSVINNYIIPVTIIESIESNEYIEDFYSLVNRSGVKLNRPELKKAEFFDTKFLKLITELSNNEHFKSLELFTDITAKRMTDVDFISELVTYLIEGISDKKIKVDKVFENDITGDQYTKTKLHFESILNVFNELNLLFPIKKTRYKQRNDFYTLFSFIDKCRHLDIETIKYFYRLLLKFNDDINPSNEKCEPFQLYAFHCISQSNSKNAREARLNFLENIFLNTKKQPNKQQKSILKYYGLKSDDFTLIEGYLTISLNILN